MEQDVTLNNFPWHANMLNESYERFDIVLLWLSNFEGICLFFYLHRIVKHANHFMSLLLVCLFVCWVVLFACLFVYLLGVWLFLCLFACLLACLFVFVCLFICLFVCLSGRSVRRQTWFLMGPKCSSKAKSLVIIQLPYQTSINFSVFVTLFRIIYVIST